jgi:beta-lactamase class A
MSADLQHLHSQISELSAQQPFAVHWQIRILESSASGRRTNASIGQGEYTQLASFSTRKVSLLLACLALVHRGELDLDQRLTITEEMKEGVQAGIMKNLAPGVELTLEDHLRQMMISSDNICTQLVFKAIAEVTGDALQWVNDYCSWVGMLATLHREIFPRSGDLEWHHSIEHMTVTTPNDQARLTGLLGEAASDHVVAESLYLSTSLCRFAVALMRQIHTPLLGANTSALEFAEKNGRGLRSLSQVGLALAPNGTAVAAVAVFAEQIPTELPSARPGRLAAYELFGRTGRAVEQWYLEQSHPPLESAVHFTTQATPERTAFCWTTLAPGTTPQQQAHAPTTLHPLSGIGKLLAALAIAGTADEDPHLLEASVTITAEDRSAAAVGPLRTHTGELTLRLADAMALVIATSDAAASVALRRALKQRRYDLVAAARSLIESLSQTAPVLEQTVVTGEEESQGVPGDLLIGQSSPQDLVRLLTALAQAGRLTEPASSYAQEPPGPAVGISRAAAEHVLGWMAGVFEPTGLAYGLPGYGPRRVPQWSVSGLELRSPASTAGWSSVLITRQQGVGPGVGVAVAAAYLSRDTESEKRLTQRPAQRLGELGLAAYRAVDRILSSPRC